MTDKPSYEPWWRAGGAPPRIERIKTIGNQEAQLLVDYLNRERVSQCKPLLAIGDLLEPCSCLVESFRRRNPDWDFCRTHRLFGQMTRGILWSSIDP